MRLAIPLTLTLILSQTSAQIFPTDCNLCGTGDQLVDFLTRDEGDFLQASGLVTFPSCCDETRCGGEKQRVAEFTTPFEDVLDDAEAVCLRVDILASVDEEPCKSEPTCSVFQGEGIPFDSDTPVRLFPCDSRLRKRDCPFCPEYDVFDREYCEGITFKSSGERACVWTVTEEEAAADTCGIGYTCETKVDPCVPVFNHSITLYKYQRKDGDSGTEFRELSSSGNCGNPDSYEAFLDNTDTVSSRYQFKFGYAGNQCAEITNKNCRANIGQGYDCCSGSGCRDRYPKLTSAVDQACDPSISNHDWVLEVSQTSQLFEYVCNRAGLRRRRLGFSSVEGRQLNGERFDDIGEDFQVPMAEMDCVAFPRPNKSKLEEVAGFELEEVQAFCETGEVDEVVVRPPYPEGRSPLFIRAVTPRVAVYQAILKGVGMNRNRCIEDIGGHLEQRFCANPLLASDISDAAINECMDCFNRTKTSHLSYCFCKHFSPNATAMRRCERTIASLGWDRAAIQLIQGVDRNRVLQTPGDGHCTRPDPCGLSLRVQFLDDSNTWVTLRNISAKCIGSRDFRSEVCSRESSLNQNLLDKKVRLVQSFDPSRCQNGVAKISLNVTYVLREDVPTSQPTNEPTTDQPTRNPTTPQPTTTSQPTNEPTSEPTTTSQPTNEPTTTAQPTNEPTSEPTNEPTTTTGPTSEPTTTTGPTSEPTTTVTPTLQPTTSPTPTSPTPSPSSSTPSPSTTSSPSTSPTPLPTSTSTPTTSPTPEPTTAPRVIGPVRPPDVCERAEDATGNAILGDKMERLPGFITARFTEAVDDDAGEDVIWVFNTTQAGLMAKIRCTATYSRSGKVFDQRLGIEELVDLRLDRHEEIGLQGEGFCVRGSFDRPSAETVHTDRISAILNPKTNEPGDACVNIPQPTKTIQRLCKRYFQGAAVKQCRKSICSALWFPFYPSEDACLEAFKGKDEKQWYESFCRALHGNTPTADMCVNNIEDFGVDSIDYECSELANAEYPATLTECQTGVEVQYYGKDYGTITNRKSPSDSDNEEWRPYVAIPTQLGQHLCPLTLDGTHPAVFNNPIRMRQKNIPNTNCLLVTPCQKVQMVATQLEYTRGSDCSVTDPAPPPPFREAPVEESVLCNAAGSTLDSCQPLSGFAERGETVVESLATMPACCPLNETQTEEGVVGHESYERFSHACNAVCNVDDEAMCCDELDETDTLTFKTTFSDLELDGTCCRNCTCYGDPRCWSFNNDYKLWIPCDARDESSIVDENGVVDIEKSCKWSRQNCESVRDHKNRACEWVIEKNSLKMGKAPLKKDKENGGVFAQYPCQVVDGRPCLHMYGVKEGEKLVGEIKLAQGPRGIIETFWFVVPDGDDPTGEMFLGYELNAGECLTNEMPWRLHRMEGVRVPGGV